MSRRIGHNKSLLRLSGRPLITYVLAVAEQLSKEIVVSIDVDQDENVIRDLLPPSARIVQDLSPKSGPLMGLLSGLSAVKSVYTLAFPCDAPFINVDVVRYLVRQVRGVDAVIPLWPNGYLEPLQSVYRVKAAKAAAVDAIESGKLRLRDMIEGLRSVRLVPVDRLRKFDPDLSTFFNINTIADLDKADEIMGKASTRRPDKI